MRLALGCAQLGMPYGPHPRTPSYPRAREIISAAWEEGIRYFDTAQAYGESERYLGQAIRELGISPMVITKLRLGDDIRLSRKRLGRNLWVLSHGWIGNFDGASVHEPEEALAALETICRIIQVPASAFDRRMERAGVFKRAKGLDRTVFVRSVLLRGEMFGITAYRDFCEQNGLDMHRFAIEYALERTGGILVIGAETPEQVRQNAEAVKKSQPYKGLADVDRNYTEEWDRIWQEDIELVRK